MTKIFPAPKYVIGIDEAGRGPLAGPVAVAALCIRARDLHLIDYKPVRDSKQLSAIAREKKYRELLILRRQGVITFSISLVSAAVIDARGIAPAIRQAIRNVLRKLTASSPNMTRSRILLDGALKAASRFKKQETIIRGDATVPIISYASIIAKVRRDRRMKKFAQEFPAYDFDVHKGYGTAGHYKKIKKHGLSTIHRRSFLKGYK